MASPDMDCFAVLEEPRRPWLDPDQLKEKFLRLSTATHPDRVHHQGETAQQRAHVRSVELNAAYQCLRDPKERLCHLIELERGEKPRDVQSVPEGLLELFMCLSGQLRQADEFLKEKARVTSPLLKVQFLERGHEWFERLGAMRNDLETRREALNGELKTLNAAWESGARPWERLEEIYRALGYLGRWFAQVQERLVQLSV